MKRKPEFGSTVEALVYPLLLVAVMWIVFWADHLFPLIDFYKWGVLPKVVSSWKGIFLMPLIHSKTDVAHIVNNSFPIAVLLGALIYYYREIALRVFSLSWIFTGLGVWLFAENANSFHIGMSGVIYALAGFLFTSGVLRKYRPLQAISLFVAFVYGSLIWGIFPMEPHVSWQGHFMGLLTGVILAFIYKKQGPQSPKYLYEIEKELGIEPPDFEGELRERIRREEERRREQEEEQGHVRGNDRSVRYLYIPKKKDPDA